MSLGFGFNSWAGAGTENVYGTPVTRAQFLKINSETLGAEDDVVKGNDVYNAAYDVSNFRQGRKIVGGDLACDLRREGAEMLLLNAMGTVAFASLGAAGTSHQRTYTVPDSIGTALTLEINRDAAAFLYHGAMINEFTISADNEGIVQLSLDDIIAEDEGTVAASTPTFSTSSYWMFQDAAVSLASGTRAVIDWKVRVNQNLTDDRYFQGSRYIGQPKRAGKMEVDGELTMEFDGTTDWNNFQSAGTQALAIALTGDTMDGTVKQSLTVNCPIVRFKKGVPSTNDAGRYIYTIPFEAFASGTTKPINIVTVNSVGTTNGY